MNTARSRRGPSSRLTLVVAVVAATGLLAYVVGYPWGGTVPSLPPGTVVATFGVGCLFAAVWGYATLVSADRSTEFRRWLNLSLVGGLFVLAWLAEGAGYATAFEVGLVGFALAAIPAQVFVYRRTAKAATRVAP